MHNTVHHRHYWGRTIASFLLVLFTMPLGHALMMIMGKFMDPVALHYAAFLMGLVGFAIVVAGVFVKGDTRQTIYGLFGGLLFWTGWVEFLFQYYARRYGTQPETTPWGHVTQPEYLLMPMTFGLWMMVMTLYIFCTRTGCCFINWCQHHLFGHRCSDIVARPMTRHTAIVTFMELNVMTWTTYILLMFCYDGRFIGDDSPVVPSTRMPSVWFCRWKSTRRSSAGKSICPFSSNGVTSATIEPSSPRGSIVVSFLLAPPLPGKTYGVLRCFFLSDTPPA